MPDLLSKKKLANFYKILAYHNIGDLTANHASILSDDKKSFYTNQHVHLFEEITTKNLIKVNLFETKKNILQKVNIAGYYIHRNIHLSKYEPEAILHTHSENAVAISSLKTGFLTKLNQSSMRFYKAVEYVDYNAIAINQDEGKKIANKLKSNTRLIILRNHGVIILGKTIEELFHLTFHFEKCASIQLKLNYQKNNIKLVSNKIAKITSKMHRGFGPVGKLSWNASLRVLKNKKK
jgi:ribulose-5-phosphate 4-epimerase/fuculose-1-phosphate aldolase